MRFGLIHRIMTDALAVLGLLALVTSNQLNPWMTGLVLIGLVVALFLPARYRQRIFLRSAGVVAPLVLLATQLCRLALGGDPIPIIIEFAAALQVIRLATRRGAAHDHQVVILALLHLIAGTVLGGGLAYAFSFIGFLVLTPGALVLSHLRREVEGNYRQGARDRTGLPVDVPRILRSRRVIGRPFLLFTCLLSIPVFVFTAILFLAFPRVGISLLMVQPIRPTRVVGFSEKVDLGGVGTLRSDPSLAMRVHIPDLPEEPPERLNLYLRGATFDRYDGRAWSRSTVIGPGPRQHGDLVAIERLPDLKRDRRMRIELSPIDPPVVFLPSKAVGLRLLSRKGELAPRPPQVVGGLHGELRYTNGERRGLDYEVFYPPADATFREQISPNHLRRYLETPSNLSPDVRDLAVRFAGANRSPEGAATAIEAALRRDYRYDLGSPSGAASDPLHHFLFVSKRGHCEFYSTAMVMMLRTLGVPSRNVTGFVGGTYNRFGEFYTVRQGDAHSWVEAYLPNRGWTRFDPTPPANAQPQSDVSGAIAFARDMLEAAAQRWSEHVVGYDLETQLSFVRAFREQWQSIAPEGGSNTRTRVRRGRVLLTLGIFVAMVVLFWVLRRRRRPPGTDGSEPRIDPKALRPIELYRRLEAALGARGVPRPPTTPPLLHARALVGAGHPTGPEALALTEFYLRARFGGEPLSRDEENDFVRRAKALRSERSDRRGPPSSGRRTLERVDEAG